MFSGLDEDSVLLVALSGHGGSFSWQDSADGHRKASFFCPQDARLGDPSGTMISIQSLFDRMEKCPARFKLLLVDACRDPHFAPSEARTAIDEVQSVADFSKALASSRLPDATVALVSCSSGEQSWEDKDLKHGIFMYYVLEALEGKADSAPRANRNGRVSYLELKDFVYRRTSDHAFKKFGRSQTPSFYANYWELSDFELVELARREPPQPVISVYTTWPFDVQEALRRQEETARTLGHPAELTDSTGLKFSLIPAGEFMMGSPEDEPGRHSDEFQHRVRITRPFYLGRHEVTVAQFREFVRERNYQTYAERGSGSFVVDPKTGEHQLVSDACWSHPTFSAISEAPVVCVAAVDAEAFCEWLGEKEAARYRLPTEAEWEYACRAGCADAWSCGSRSAELDRYANSGKSITIEQRSRILPVGRGEANGFGLFDMHGNVSEWCSDWYASGYYGRAVRADPLGPEKSFFRVYRGGAWPDTSNGIRSAKRFSRPATQASFDLSFRVVREIP